ncbi:predicted protein [Uncinocarpus reesii 1704]|uniref:NAA35-like N-terminal domain-containing protein n=1 Tax=Uncinocarpus reesii (strain UAMH 1704) TaxID=336963 RepID=C4JMP5_UNCRE|nr:uncharacterized protein UREG_04103 [Uncinocarpus reesii 1704]EEP79257.1 predicted protein [Uncinocarpus reesii 1704]
MYRTKGPPRIASEKMEAHDITEEFTKAASALETGQLVKDEFFTLFEAVGALEVRHSFIFSFLIESPLLLRLNYVTSCYKNDDR